MEIDVPGRAGVLLVAEDRALRSEMAAYLAAQGYAVRQAVGAAEVRRILDQRSIAVIVLDAGGEAGSILRTLGPEDPPVLVLSVLGAEAAVALDAGDGRRQQAAKPIRPDELLARVNALATLA